jgi:hypothetical protein
MSSLDAVLKQYEQNQVNSSSTNNISREERLKKYFAAFLPKGEEGGEKVIRLLPTSDGSSPFKEVYYHEIQIDGKWTKLLDPGKNGDGTPTGERSPLNEVEEALKMTGNEKDKEIARQYRSKKFYIVKIIDRGNEDEGIPTQQKQLLLMVEVHLQLLWTHKKIPQQTTIYHFNNKHLWL